MFAVRSSLFHFGTNCNLLQLTTLRNEPTFPEVQVCFLMMSLTMTIIPNTIGVNAPNFTKFGKVPTC